MTDQINQLIERLSNAYDNNITTKLGKITNKQWFVFIIIIIIFLYIAKSVNITLSIVFFLLIALLICYLIYSRKQVVEPIKEVDTDLKMNLINPKPNQQLQNHPDLVDFLYSIRNLNHVNPDAFKTIIIDMNNFIQLYDEIMNNQMIYCTENLEVAVDFIRDAQNNLQSMIYNLDSSQLVTWQFHNSLKEFQFLVRQYVKRMIDKCNCVDEDQINNGTKFYQEYGPKPVNYYEKSRSSSMGLGRSLPRTTLNGENQFEFY